MLRDKVIGLLLAGLIGGTALAAPAAMSKYGEGFGHGALRKLIEGNLGRWMVLRSELNLTQAQRTKIHQAVGSHRTEIAKTAKEVWEKRTALREAVANGQDETAIRQAAEQLGKAIGDAAVLASRVRGEVQPMLTEAQHKMIADTRQANIRSVEEFFNEATKVQ